MVRMPKLLPKTRTQRALEGLGWLVGDCESRHGQFIKRDLFGIADLVAIKGRRCLFVQATDHTSFGKHVTKLAPLQTMRVLLRCGHEVLMFGWSQDKLVPRVERFAIDESGVVRTVPVSWPLQENPCPPIP